MPKTRLRTAHSLRETRLARILEFRSRGRIRQYDPEVGRWLQRDPILFAGGGANLYEYTISDSINFIDVDGLFKLPANPSGLPKGWVPDPRHKDHWHPWYDGKKCKKPGHLFPGDNVLDPTDEGASQMSSVDQSVIPTLPAPPFVPIPMPAPVFETIPIF